MVPVSVQNKTRSALGGARLVYSNIAKEILPHWEISLVFIGPKEAQTLNKQLRGKAYVPNVLSYVVGEKSGEIIICPNIAKEEAPAYGLNEKDFILYLFIHGVLHIKGWVHGGTMEECERTLMAKYATRSARTFTHVTTHRNRHRHRDVPGKDGRRRGTLR